MDCEVEQRPERQDRSSVTFCHPIALRELCELVEQLDGAASVVEEASDSCLQPRAAVSPNLEPLVLAPIREVVRIGLEDCLESRSPVPASFRVFDRSTDLAGDVELVIAFLL